MLSSCCIWKSGDLWLQSAGQWPVTGLAGWEWWLLWSEPCKLTLLSSLLLLFSQSVVSNSFVTSWTVACQAPVSMEFPRQEYWSGLLFPSPRDISDPEMEPVSPALQVDSLLLSHQGSWPEAVIPSQYCLPWLHSTWLRLREVFLFRQKWSRDNRS